MKRMDNRPFSRRPVAHQTAMVTLRAEPAVERPRKDLARKMQVRPDLFLIGEVDGSVVAAVMAGHDGHHGWITVWP